MGRGKDAEQLAPWHRRRIFQGNWSRHDRSACHGQRTAREGQPDRPVVPSPRLDQRIARVSARRPLNLAASLVTTTRRRPTVRRGGNAGRAPGELPARPTADVCAGDARPDWMDGPIAKLKRHRGVSVAKSALDVSSPVAKASAAALMSDCAWARATAARAEASPVCAAAASVNVPMPCA